jgi:hypothetical protein
MNTEIPMVAEPTAILKLAGDGYTLSVTAETVAHKASLLAAAGAVTEVTDDNQVAVAQFQIRHLAAFRNTVEKSRLEVKRPIIDLGKKIDEAAQSFAGEIVLEETRIKKLVARHAEEVAAEKRRAEAEERRKFEEARKAKEDAERAARLRRSRVVRQTRGDQRAGVGELHRITEEETAARHTRGVAGGNRDHPRRTCEDLSADQVLRNQAVRPINRGVSHHCSYQEPLPNDPRDELLFCSANNGMRGSL